MAFRFFSPRQPDISGIIAGSQGILQGGQAQGAGLAAEGAAMGQAFESIGQSVGAGIAKRAADEKAEQRSTAIKAYLDAAREDGNFTEVPSRDIEDVPDPNVQAMWDRASATEGDPDAIRAQLVGDLVSYYETSHGKDREAALSLAQDLLKVRTDRQLTPDARARLQNMRAELIEVHGVEPHALRAIVDGAGVEGYVNDKARADANRKRIADYTQFQTPAEKARLKLQEEQLAAEQSRQRALQEEAEIEGLIQRAISDPVTIPIPGLDQVPTGLHQRRGLTAVSMGSETGVEEQFVQRASQAGVPADAMVQDLRSAEQVSFVGRQSVTDVRRLLREKGLSDTAIDRELVDRRIFSDRNDRNYQGYVDERIKEIERRHLPSEAPVDRMGGFTKSEQRFISSMDAGLAQSLKAGSRVSAVPLGSLQNVDLQAVGLALEGFGDLNSPDKLSKIMVGLDEKGDVTIKSGVGESLADIQGSPKVKATLERVLGMQELRREVAYMQATGGFEGRSKTQVNTYMEHLRVNRPELFKQLMRDASGGIKVEETIPTPADAPLDAGEAALLGRDPLSSITSGAVVGEAPPAPPTQTDLDADARRRQHLPPAPDPIRAERQQAFEQIKPDAEAFLTDLRKTGQRLILEGNTGKGRRILQAGTTLARAIDKGDRGATLKLMEELRSLVDGE